MTTTMMIRRRRRLKRSRVSLSLFRARLDSALLAVDACREVKHKEDRKDAPRRAKGAVQLFHLAIAED